jgi:hypothetical protein
MKKIIKSSALILGICFIAGKANAQLASDAPALTPQKVILLQKDKATPAAAQKAAPVVQTASSAATVKAPAVTAAKASDKSDVVESAKPAVVPAVPVVPMQTDKAKPVNN